LIALVCAGVFVMETEVVTGPQTSAAAEEAANDTLDTDLERKVPILQSLWQFFKNS
jgi:hypothetical protein